MLRVFVLALVLSASASAVAQDRVVLVQASADGSTSGELARWVRAIRPVLGDPSVRPLGDCWPEDAVCASQLVTAGHAQRILLVRVLWERAGCVPIRDASGAATGHRQLRVATLDLTLIDAQGHTVAHVTHAAEVADASTRRAAAVALLAQLGLGV